jgi:hypothetical protein
MSEDILARIVIALLGVAGFFVARHIYREKQADRPLVCPVNFDCDGVKSAIAVASKLGVNF